MRYNDFMKSAAAQHTHPWDTKLAVLHGGSLQSEGWGVFLKAQGAHVIEDKGDDWLWRGQIQETALGRYLYLPQGPVVATPKAWLQAQHSIRAAALDHKALFVRAEPTGDAATLIAAPWRRVADWQPSHTAHIDLTLSEELLRRGLKSGHRSAINGAERRGLIIESSVDPADMAVLTDLLADARGWQTHSADYLQLLASTLMPRGEATLYIARHGDTPVAVALAHDVAGRRTYLHAAMNADGRRLQAAAPLVWRMVLDAKAAGMSVFDLGGVAPEKAAANHPWSGFTSFKLGFGGKRITRAGTWELALKPVRYNAYKLYKRARAR